MTNPFDALEERLINIEKILVSQKPSSTLAESSSRKPAFKFWPIQEIFDNKICSKPCFYAHVRAGDFTLYKFGNKSFVDMEEFQNAFRKVKINNKKM